MLFAPVALSLFLLPVAASCGWWAGFRQKKTNNQHKFSHKMRRDYFKGLNYLINEQPDKAVDVFIRLLEVDSDTVETHLALGSLFRRRGEVDRAIRVHQNLIARPQLAKQHKSQALSELGQDYFRAGVLDRAERIFLELVSLGEESQSSLHFLLRIYQQEKDWFKAIETAEKWQSTTESKQHMIAQFYCELTDNIIKNKSTGTDINQAINYLKRAQAADKNCARIYMLYADIAKQHQQYKDAINYYQRIIEKNSDYISEIINPMIDCYQKLGEQKQMYHYFQRCLENFYNIHLVLAVADYIKETDGDKAAIEFISEQIQDHNSLQGLDRLVALYIDNTFGEAKGKLLILRSYLQELCKNQPLYRCTHCGFSGRMFFWHCPSCHYWSSIKPIQAIEEK